MDVDSIEKTARLSWTCSVLSWSWYNCLSPTVPVISAWTRVHCGQKHELGRVPKLQIVQNGYSETLDVSDHRGSLLDISTKLPGRRMQ